MGRWDCLGQNSADNDACPLFDHVVASGRRNHLLVVDIDEARNLPDRGSIAPELIGKDRVWDIIFTEQPDQEGPCSVGISVLLKQDIQHEAVLVHCSSAVKRGQPRCSDQDEPVSDTIDARMDTVGEFMLGKKAHHDL